MPKVKVISSRFRNSEGWQPGDVVAMDEESARVPLENGEVELVAEKKSRKKKK